MHLYHRREEDWTLSELILAILDLNNRLTKQEQISMDFPTLLAELQGFDTRLQALKTAVDALKAQIAQTQNVPQNIIDAANAINTDLTAVEQDAAPPAPANP